MTPEEIKAIRAQLGWTQQSLADAVGVSVRAVKFWEAGDRNPSGPVVILLRSLIPDTGPAPRIQVATVSMRKPGEGWSREIKFKTYSSNSPRGDNYSSHGRVISRPWPTESEIVFPYSEETRHFLDIPKETVLQIRLTVNGDAVELFEGRLTENRHSYSPYEDMVQTMIFDQIKVLSTPDTNA